MTSVITHGPLGFCSAWQVGHVRVTPGSVITDVAPQLA